MASPSRSAVLAALFSLALSGCRCGGGGVGDPCNGPDDCQEGLVCSAGGTCQKTPAGPDAGEDGSLPVADGGDAAAADDAGGGGDAAPGDASPGTDAAAATDASAPDAGAAPGEIECSGITCAPGESCCIGFGGPSSCVPAGTACPGGSTAVSCDGPEDCPGPPAGVCCWMKIAGTMCAAAGACAGLALCHTDADCSAPQTCALLSFGYSYCM